MITLLALIFALTFTKAHADPCVLSPLLSAENTTKYSGECSKFKDIDQCKKLMDGKQRVCVWTGKITLDKQTLKRLKNLLKQNGTCTVRTGLNPGTFKKATEVCENSLGKDECLNWGSDPEGSICNWVEDGDAISELAPVDCSQFLDCEISLDGNTIDCPFGVYRRSRANQGEWPRLRFDTPIIDPMIPRKKRDNGAVSF